MALEHSQMQSVILQRTAELQNLSQRLLKVQDEERRKLSRDLHDSTGQTLAALRMSILLLQQHCKEEPSKMALFSRRALEKELQDILKITNPLVPATLDPNSPTAMSVPEVESEELDRLRKRRDEIQQMLDDDGSEEDMRARVL
jgi:signal transduction histidine kinase